ncbi:hypothetical protein MRX96_053428 [Rhipicephalus microplus]
MMVAPSGSRSMEKPEARFCWGRIRDNPSARYIAALLVLLTPRWEGDPGEEEERASCGRRVRAAACARRTGPYYFDDDAATDYPTPVEHGAYAAAGHDYAPEKHPTTPGA